MGDSGTTQNADEPGNNPPRVIAGWLPLTDERGRVGYTLHARVQEADDEPVARPVAVVMFTDDLHERDDKADELVPRSRPNAEMTTDPEWTHAAAHFVGQHERPKILPVLRAMVDARQNPPASVDALVGQVGDLLDLLNAGQPRRGGAPVDIARLAAQYRAEQEIRHRLGEVIGAGQLNDELWQLPEFENDDESTLRRRRRTLAELPDLRAALDWTPPTDNERHARDRQHMARLDPMVAAIMEGVAHALADQSPPKSPPSEPGNE